MIDGSVVAAPAPSPTKPTADPEPKPSTPPRIHHTALSELSPLKANEKCQPNSSLIVQRDSRTVFPQSVDYFHKLSLTEQESVRSGSSEDDVWKFITTVHAEWAVLAELEQNELVSTANRKSVATTVFQCIKQSRSAQMSRLLAGVGGVGKTRLLTLLCVATQIAYGDSLLAIYHDFKQDGKDQLRHSLPSVLREAILTRWPDSEESIDARLSKMTGHKIARAQQLCSALGKEQTRPVSVSIALFVDEVQNLFEDTGTERHGPSQSLLAELKTAALVPRLATFLSGSAYSLIDGLKAQNFNLGPLKMPTSRLLPITERAELAAIKALWHPDWSNTVEFAHLTGANQVQELNEALETRCFLLTGGVLLCILWSTRQAMMEHCVKEPAMDSLELAVLAYLYAVNRHGLEQRGETAAAAPGQNEQQAKAARDKARKFDPFRQSKVPLEEVCSGLRDERVEERAIRDLVDAGWLLLDARNSITFLRPAHYGLMEHRLHDLTLQERAALHFPEGRKLGEQWEVFYAEHLVENHGLQWFDLAQPRHIEPFRHGVTHDEMFFKQHQSKIFKPSPDVIGYGQRAYPISVCKPNHLGSY